MVQQDEKVMRFFPRKMAKGRVTDRDYFFNILNTWHPVYVQTLITHANEQRNSVASEARAFESIEISDQWWE